MTTAAPEIRRSLADSLRIDALAQALYRLEREAGRRHGGVPWETAPAPVRETYRRRAAVAWTLGDPVKVALLPTRVARPSEGPSVSTALATVITARVLRTLEGEVI